MIPEVKIPKCIKVDIGGSENPIFADPDVVVYVCDMRPIKFNHPKKEAMKDHYVWIPCDVRRIPLPDNFAHVVHAGHILEHFPITETEAVLREWIRLVKPDGEFILRVPDLLKTVEMYQRGEIPFWHPDPEQRSLIRHLYGTPAYPGGFHHCGFTEEMLRHFLEPHFERIERRYENPHVPAIELFCYKRKW
jgi:predicted SAM-dependent methyltransferase